MHIRTLVLSVNCFITAFLIQACSGDSARKVDPFEQLERPPQIAVSPQTELPAVSDETAISNGLGKNVKLLGKKSAPILKLNMDFDNAWQILEKALHYQKIAITDHDRAQGNFLVNFDTDGYIAEEGFFSGLSDRLFAESYGLRKYQLTVKQKNNGTFIIATDIGAITTEADAKDDVDEVVDTKIKGPNDSEYRLMSILYKSLRDGFIESGMHHKRDMDN